jgi:hypothetical protein
MWDKIYAKTKLNSSVINTNTIIIIIIIIIIIDQRYIQRNIYI